MNKDKRTNITLTSNGKAIEEKETANFINDYFTSIGPNLDKLIQNNSNSLNNVLLQHNKIMEDIRTNQDEVIKLCKAVQICKSSGIQNLSSLILKDAFLALPEQLTYIFNLSLRSGIFPTQWKHAMVIPVPKGGDSSDVGNLRPISLLPLPGKLLEKIVHRSLMSFVTENDLLTEHQGGFRPGYSTVKTVAEFTDDIYDAINRKECTLATFIDFRKAFDTVNHTILTRKLKSIGVSQNNLSWFESYLSNRKQQTLANNEISTKKDVSIGVPQGSLLGPLLFLIYINDIANLTLSSKFKLYADDIVLYTCSKDPVKASSDMQNDLNTITNWCDNNRLTINTGKTKCVIFGSKNKLKSYVSNPVKVKGICLQFVSSYKYLGIYLDNSMRFTTHMCDVVKKAAHKIYQLSKIKQYLTSEAALRLYKVMILPYFDYGDVLFCTTNQTLSDKMQRLQNRALRICTLSSSTQSTKQLHTLSKTPLLTCRQNIHLRNFMHKRGKIDKYLDKKSINTRSRDGLLFKTERPTCELYKNSVKFKGAYEWNNLDANMRNITNYSQFKLKQKLWLQESINKI